MVATLASIGHALAQNVEERPINTQPHSLPSTGKQSEPPPTPIELLTTLVNQHQYISRQLQTALNETPSDSDGIRLLERRLSAITTEISKIRLAADETPQAETAEPPAQPTTPTKIEKWDIFKDFKD
jgi:hypothetical protein